MAQPFTTLVGVAAPLMIDDLNTDQLIPSEYLRRLHGNLADGFLAYMRRRPDGSSNPDFVLEKPQFRNAAILAVGENFGCGSSREHAAWAMAAFGIRCVIGNSHAEYFRENCIKNGILAISIGRESMRAFAQAASEFDGHQPFTVDLGAQTIAVAGAQYLWRFDIDSYEKTVLLEGLDEIGQTAKYRNEIAQWEARTARERPFMQKLQLGLTAV
ncbi:3-isopropylmalate dehydratase small subunit [Microbacteriaceae bacterium K1510]|nr:3-isopropylmalate dehydratase small subunit [Microbacteriaceae bacterium K1510]